MRITLLSRKVWAAVGLSTVILGVGCSAPSAPSPPPNSPASATTIAGRWDLVSLDHKSLPLLLTNPSAGQPGLYVVEGHIVFEPNGTYRKWVVQQVQGQAKRDSVIFVSSYTAQAFPTLTVMLQIDPGINEGSGGIAGGVLSITYTDFLDWWDEMYVRAR